MRFHFYHVVTGRIHGNTYSTSILDPARALESALMNAPPDHRPIEGRFDHLSQHIDVETGAVVDYKPPSPSADHEWDEISRRWRLTANALTIANRKIAASTRIAHLETNVQPRALRESALNISGASKRLQDIEDEISALRKDLTK